MYLVLLSVEGPQRAKPLDLETTATDAVEEPHRATNREPIRDGRQDEGVGELQEEFDLDGYAWWAIDDGEVVIRLQPLAEQPPPFLVHGLELVVGMESTFGLGHVGLEIIVQHRRQEIMKRYLAALAVQQAALAEQ